ncbi:MAG: hypothetical protein AB4352_15430 [Hormoscilla sp.]
MNSLLLDTHHLFGFWRMIHIYQLLQGNILNPLISNSKVVGIADRRSDRGTLPSGIATKP